MQFRKKPVVIEAVKWNGHGNNLGLTNGDPMADGARYEMPDWMPACLPPLVTEAMTRAAVEPGEIRRYEDFLHIGTLEGVMACAPGDWIIRGVKGELYPCKPDIFAATYEPAEPTAADLGAEVRRLGLAGQ